MITIILPTFFLAFSLFAQDTVVKLGLPWKHQFQFAGYYMAIEKGFYKDVNLKVIVEEFDAKKSNVQEVSQGRYEFGIRHATLILDILQKYPNIKLLAALNQSSPLVLISKNSTNATSIQDIKSTNVMINFEDNSNAAIDAMLISNNIALTSYTRVPVTFNIEDFLNSPMQFRTAYRSNELFKLNELNISYTVYAKI